jgi:hypothetical protein
MCEVHTSSQLLNPHSLTGTVALSHFLHPSIHPSITSTWRLLPTLYSCSFSLWSLARSKDNDVLMLHFGLFCCLLLWLAGVRVCRCAGACAGVRRELRRALICANLQVVVPRAARAACVVRLACLAGVLVCTRCGGGIEH